MNSKKRILLLVNWKNRDLRGLVQLKLVLEKKYDYDVELVDHNFYFWKYIMYRPHFVLFPQVQAEREKALFAKKMGSMIGVLHSEGNTSKKNEHAFFSNIDNVLEVITDFRMVWGQEFKKLYDKYTDINQEEIFVTGNPRFDIYNKPLINLLEKPETLKKRYSINNDKKIILFCTNFVHLDRDESAIERAQEFKKYDMMKRISLEKKLFIKTISCVSKIADDFSDYTIILKTHPLEFSEKYKDKLAEKENVILIKKENTSSLINICDLFLNTNSTTSTEAGFLNKPTITLNFVEEYDEYLSPFVEGTQIAKNCNELNKLIKDYDNGKDIPQYIIDNRRKFEKDWYYKIDGKSTYRVADVIHNEIERSRKKEFISDSYSDLFYIKEVLLNNPHLRSLVNFIIKSLGKSSYYSKISETELTRKHDIKNEIEKIKRNMYGKYL